MQPKLLIIAGPNGAGKTSITRKILRHEWIAGCEYINPDNIARDLFGDWNSPEAVLQAARYATEKRYECLAQKNSLLFETVLSSEEKIEFVRRARREGYFIRLFFVGTDNPQINAARVAARVMAGGHDVPVPKIISRYGKSISNCARLYVYDNSLEDPQLLFRGAPGKVEKTYAKINDWAQPIWQTLNERNALLSP